MADDDDKTDKHGAGVRRLLVVDDNPVSRAIGIGLAANLGCHAEGAKDGEQALMMLAGCQYDLVLMDCDMPRLDGFTTCRLMRQAEGGGRRVPVVALSAGTDSGQHARCMAAGMDAVLPKPLSLRALQELVHRWLPRGTDATAAEPANSDDHDDDHDGILAVAQYHGRRYPELASLWITDSARRLSLLQAAVAQRDHPTAAKTAHAMSGGCAAIGATGLSALCRQLELEARIAISADNADNADDMQRHSPPPPPPALPALPALLARIVACHDAITRRLQALLQSASS